MQSSHVVVTGASGHLGSHLVPQLLDAGFQVVGLDVAPTSFEAPGFRFHALDLGDFDALKEVLGGTDVVVHCASLHPWKPYSDAQYFDANVKGTWNLYRAASESGVSKIVLTSSIAAIGYAAPPEFWPVKEDNLFVLSDLYSLTKHTQEDIARHFADTTSVRTLALRPPAFFPRSVEETALWLVGAFLLVDDVVEAHVAAVKAMLQAPSELQAFEPIFIMQPLPYTRDDVTLCERESLWPVLERHYPRVVPWLRSLDFRGTGVPVVYDTGKSERILGWRAQYNLASWFELHGPKEAK